VAGFKVTTEVTANQSMTGLATFRATMKKYPDRDRRKVLSDLAASSGDPGVWFAAAKGAGLLDLAVEFARAGRTDPRTLRRAARDFLAKDAQFSLAVGRLAIQRILDGYGYELTSVDVNDACKHVMAAAHVRGVTSQAQAEMQTIAAERPGMFRDLVVRQCSAGVVGN